MIVYLMNKECKLVVPRTDYRVIARRAERPTWQSHRHAKIHRDCHASVRTLARNDMRFSFCRASKANDHL